MNLKFMVNLHLSTFPWQPLMTGPVSASVLASITAIDSSIMLELKERTRTRRNLYGCKRPRVDRNHRYASWCFWYSAVFEPCIAKRKYLSLLNGSTCLTHFSQMFYFDTPWKFQKTNYFLTFSDSIEIKHWAKMGWAYS